MTPGMELVEVAAAIFVPIGITVLWIRMRHEVDRKNDYFHKWRSATRTIEELEEQLGAVRETCAAHRATIRDQKQTIADLSVQVAKQPMARPTKGESPVVPEAPAPTLVPLHFHRIHEEQEDA